VALERRYRLPSLTSRWTARVRLAEQLPPSSPRTAGTGRGGLSAAAPVAAPGALRGAARGPCLAGVGSAPLDELLRQIQSAASARAPCGQASSSASACPVQEAR